MNPFIFTQLLSRYGQLGGLGTRTCTHVLNKGNQSHLEKGNQEAKWNTSMMKLFHLQRLSRNKNLFFLTRNKVFPSYPAAIHFLEQAPPQPYSLMVHFV